MLARLAQFALVALGLAGCNPASAAPLIYGTYYDEKADASCNVAGASFCRLNFSQLPADKLLMVTKINCQIFTAQPMSHAYLHISASLGGGSVTPRSLPLAVPASKFTGITYSTSFREDTHFLIGNGRFPNIQVGTQESSHFGITCTMIGELITPIQ